MKGLELSRLYYENICEPKIKEHFPELYSRMAAGLVGQGSECYGFDDEISRDHDFGPSCCIWLISDDYKQYGEQLQGFLDLLPKSFMGFAPMEENQWEDKRRGVFEIESFYYKFTGKNKAPLNPAEWLRIPEEGLSTATNGAIFYDGSGNFSKIRNEFLEYYPEDVRLDKIAARCMNIAQSGQYNFPRSVKRSEFVAASIAEGEFIKELIYMAYLLNRKYKPFYKWMHRGLLSLPILGTLIYDRLNTLISIPVSDYNEKSNIIEEICLYFILEMKNQRISNSNSDFLLDHGVIVQKNIKDPALKNRNPWLG